MHSGGATKVLPGRGNTMDDFPTATQRPSLLPGICCQTVLCWVGSCDEREEVVEVGLALARHGGGKVQVVMGLDSPHRFHGQHGENGPATPLTPEVIGRAERRLAKLYGPGAPTMVLPGHPVAEVRRYARNHRVDLIVMGSQALQVEDRYGERLFSQAPCPVLIIVKPGESSSGQSERQMLQTER